jgi:hypothetical protein
MSERDPRICGHCGRELQHHRYFEVGYRGRILCPGTVLVLGPDGDLHVPTERELRELVDRG